MEYISSHGERFFELFMLLPAVLLFIFAAYHGR